MSVYKSIMFAYDKTRAVDIKMIPITPHDRIEVFYQQYANETDLEYAGYLLKVPKYRRPIARIFNMKSFQPPVAPQ